ncbi:hypothetical protein D3C76_953310 [compost metagenome]
MDYPKSVPNVGLVGGKFVDENTATGVVGSLIPSVWGNSVTDELLNILSAAGIAPSEAALDQLLQALRGNGLFQTPAFMDVTQRVATTAFAQRALGNFSAGRSEIGSGLTLPVTDAGKYVALTLGASQTVALPLLAAVLDGATITLHNPTTFDKIVTVNGGNLIAPDGTGLTIVTLKQGDTASFTSQSAVWRMHGVGALKYSAQFNSLLSANGYQKLPSGLIVQWMQAPTDASGNVTFNFPMTFPGARLRDFPRSAGGAGSLVADATTATNSQLTYPVKLVSGASAPAGVNCGLLVLGN